MQKKEIREWCQNKYGKDWWNVDPLIKKARLDEAKKALDKPYAKKPAMKAGNGAKLCANKGIEQTKPVYYMRYIPPPDDEDEDEDDDESGVEDWIAEVPPLVAVTNTFNKYLFYDDNKIKFEGNNYAQWWSVWIYDHWDGDIMLGTTPFVSHCGDDQSCYDSTDGLSAADVLLLLCKDGKWENKFGPYTEPGFHPGPFEIDNTTVIVGEKLWGRVSQEIRARFLRECFAKRVLILDENAC